MWSKAPLLRLVLASLLLLNCGTDDPTVERRGGPVPEPTGSAGQGAAGPTGGDAIPFCSALAVIRARCQACHSSPPQHGAPVPFVTYEDIQAPYFNSAPMKFSDAMVDAIKNDFMPLLSLNDPPVSLMPPAQPLTADEKATLLGWLEQGAKPEGGTDCP
jgi:hypothetical protein